MLLIYSKTPKKKDKPAVKYSTTGTNVTHLQEIIDSTISLTILFYTHVSGIDLQFFKCSV